MTEQKLLDWLIDNFDSSIKKAEYKYSRFDAYSKDRDQFIELKCRRTHYETLIIEKKKFDTLVEDGSALYICSTPEGIYSWTIDKDTEIEWIAKSMPKNTDFGNRARKDKIIGYLEIKKANKLK
jgi:hypothetical protein